MQLDCTASAHSAPDTSGGSRQSTPIDTVRPGTQVLAARLVGAPERKHGSQCGPPERRPLLPQAATNAARPYGISCSASENTRRQPTSTDMTHAPSATRLVHRKVRGTPSLKATFLIGVLHTIPHRWRGASRRSAARILLGGGALTSQAGSRRACPYLVDLSSQVGGVQSNLPYIPLVTACHYHLSVATTRRANDLDA